MPRSSTPPRCTTLLEEALPDGLDVLEVVESAGGSLADLLEASHWLLDVTAPLDEVQPAVERFLAESEVAVERMTKKGLRTFDCRAAVVSLTAGPGDRGARLDVVLRHGVPSVRPDDVLTGLREVAGLDTGESALLTRLAQGRLGADGSVSDPLA